MSPNPVATTPSERFLRDGAPNGAERAAIETLTRRRNFLADLEESNSYDRRELAALSWALSLVAYLRKGADDDRARVVP